MGPRTTLALFGSIILLAAPASARNTEHFYAVEDAVTSALGQKKLLNVRFYFAGQEHPGVKKVLGEWPSRRSTRGVFRSDLSSCQVAFLSALINLQKRAKREGGDAIIDIKSITRGKETSSATEYRCVAGSTVVHVGLTGEVVQLK